MPPAFTALVPVRSSEMALVPLPFTPRALTSVAPVTAPTSCVGAAVLDVLTWAMDPLVLTA